MHTSPRTRRLSISAIIFLVGLSVMAQNYRDQRILIRLNPGYCMLFGKITDYDGNKLSRAEISVYDPTTFVITETIPVDDSGEYLFTLRKGTEHGLLISKSGYFSYYHVVVIPPDAPDEFVYPLQLPDGIRKDYTLIYPPDGRIPANTGILEELISLLINQTSLNLWMPDQENLLGKSRIQFIDSLSQARGVEKYRLVSGSLPVNKDQIVQLNFETDPDAEMLATYNTEGQAVPQDQKWTLQFAASKSKLSQKDLNGLKDYTIYEGKDGFYRYTYGVYNTRQQTSEGIAVLKSKGFSQAFPKQIGNLKTL